jgi:hypothetical protein
VQHPVELATHSFRQLYLYAFATQAEVLQHVRMEALAQESERLEEIMANWASLQPRVDALIQDEQADAETIEVAPIPSEHEDRVAPLFADPLFQRSFAALPSSAALVEADKLIAPQRTVNLDYVDRLLASYPSAPELRDAIDICLSAKRAMDPIQHLELGPSTHAFTSPNSDLRFLGAFVKDLDERDLDYAVMGGLPVAAVIAFVGYGAPPVSVLRAGGRLVLQNGFHRVYALRSLGLKMLPAIVQDVHNPDLAFPPAVAGLPREYLLGAARPVLIKDFFEPDFAITLEVQERLRMVTVGINRNDLDVPA